MRPPRILISDDDPLVLRTLATLAAREGLQVIEDDRQDVALLARTSAPDVILVDIHQPDVDGRNLLIQLKEDPQTSKIEVFVMSGRPEPYTRTECLLLGALEFLAKPIDLDMFMFVSRVAKAARDGSIGVRPAPRVKDDPAPAASCGQPAQRQSAAPFAFAEAEAAQPALESTRSTSFGPPVPIS